MVPSEQTIVRRRPANVVRRAIPRHDDACATTPVPGSHIHSWRVEGELGRGGMASVYAVVHARSGKPAAVKLAHAAVLGDSVTPDTFWREARVARSIRHPAVAQMIAMGSCGGLPYLVMERLTGTTLGERVDAGPPMPRGEAIEMLLELCDVLRAAHAAGVVHRDLKLDNVFLVDDPLPGHRRVKLLDWGVAHIAGEDDPFRGLIAGTLTYVAPEQIRGDEVTPAADIYSLAVLAYHLVCRRAPFVATSDLALLHLHLRAEPPRPSIAWAEIPPALEELLCAMMAKQPDERPGLDEVERVLRDALTSIAPVRAARLETVRPLPARPSLIDVLGRPVLSAPRLRPEWLGLALVIVVLASLFRLLS